MYITFSQKLPSMSTWVASLLMLWIGPPEVLHAQSASDSLLVKLRQEEAMQKRLVDAWLARQANPSKRQISFQRLLAIDRVETRHPVYLTTHNATAALTTQTVFLYPGAMLDLALTGADLEIGAWDGGQVLADHQELIGRVNHLEPAANLDHATHVAGTIMAQGVRVQARGMAYEAQIRTYDWDNDASEMTSEARRGLLISNHSYGRVAGWDFADTEGTGTQWYWHGDPRVSASEDFAFGWYDNDAAQYDAVAYTHPFFLPIVAAGNDRNDVGPGPNESFRILDEQGDWQTATDRQTLGIGPDGGNDGYDSIAGGSVAKNVLTVGSIGDPNAAFEAVSSFSGFGPTDDGRIKPDVLGYGSGVFSSIAGGTNRYQFISGTSMATANVSGTLLLLQQHHHNLSGRYMRAASLKGLAIHTADDLGPQGPDYANGWGLLNAVAAATHLNTILENPLALFEDELTNDAIFTQAATVAEKGPVRITLSWTDPASTLLDRTNATALNNPTPHLRNDLDVRLIHEATQTTFRPFVLDSDQPLALAVAGDNRVDPIEQIYLPEAEVGQYTLVVSHKGSLWTGADQPFSLLVSGAADALRTVAVSRFTADVEDTQVLLAWETAFERSAGTLILERAPLSFDTDLNRQVGPFSVITTISTQTTSETAQFYSFTDELQQAGRYVFRLRFENAETAYIAAELDVNVLPPEQYSIASAYPNPFQDRAVILVSLPRTQHIKVEVFNLLGQPFGVYFNDQLRAGLNPIPIDGSGWPDGVYVVRVLSDLGVRTHRIVRID